jgi:uncharacterized protein YegP (UPF0339 family)
MRAYVLEIYEDQSRTLRWRLKTRGRVVADSAEGYSTMQSLLSTLDRLSALLLRQERYRVMIRSLGLRTRVNASILGRKLSVPMAGGR